MLTYGGGFVSAGKKRYFMRLLIPVPIDDGEGGQRVTWTEGHGFWADIKSVSAREQAIAGVLQVPTSHRVITDYDRRITEERRLARVSPEGRELQIVGVRDPEGLQREMEVDCTEVV